MSDNTPSKRGVTSGKGKADPSKAKRRPRTKNAPTVHPNSVHITVYDPQGAPVPPDVLEAAANSVADLARQHQLLISTARG